MLALNSVQPISNVISAISPLVDIFPILSSRFPELEKLSTEGEIAEVSLEAGQRILMPSHYLLLSTSPAQMLKCHHRHLIEN